MSENPLYLEAYERRDQLLEGRKPSEVLKDASEELRTKVAELVRTLVPDLTLEDLEKKPTALGDRWHQEVVDAG